MAHVINHKKIGGNETGKLAFSAWFEGESSAEDAYLIKQKSKNKFKLGSVSGSKEGFFTIVDAPTKAGECSLSAVAFGDQIYSIDATWDADTDIEYTAGGTPEDDGDYDLTLVTDVEAITPAVLTFSFAGGDLTGVTIKNVGEYASEPSTYSVTGLEGDVVINSIDWDTISVEKSIKKIAQHRITTTSNEVFKYKVGVAAGAVGEATIDTLS